MKLVRESLFPSMEIKKGEKYILHNWDNENPVKILIKDIKPAQDEVTFEAPNGKDSEKVESWFNLSKINKVSGENIILKENLEHDRPIEAADDHPWNQVYKTILDKINKKRITNEDQLDKTIDIFKNLKKWPLSEDDIEDAAWAAWQDGYDEEGLGEFDEYL